MEDDRELSSALAKGLREEGYAVDQAFDGENGLVEALSGEHDLLLLDVMLPCSNGYSILVKMRQQRSLTPVIFLTARGEIENRIQGLQLGGDDYLVKPFSFEELLARIKAVLRRSARCAQNRLRRGNLELDLDQRRVWWEKTEISLTPREFAILEAFLMARDRVLSRSDIIRHCCDDSYDYDSNLIDVHIGHLRRKLRAAAGAPLIETVRGQGFRIPEPGS
ncbi:MAG: response regulator transcription factor [Candidatus Methylomirabilia bacterium]